MPPRRTYANVTGANAKKPPDIPAPAQSPTAVAAPLFSRVPDMFRIVAPQSFTPDVIAKALQKELGHTSDWTLATSDGCMQLHMPVRPSTPLFAKIMNDGIVVDNTTIRLRQLAFQSSDRTYLQIRISNFFGNEAQLEDLKSTFGTKWGRVVTSCRSRIADTSIFDGSIDLVLDTPDNAAVPPAHVTLEHGNWSQDLSVTIVSKIVYCSFCRSREHRRADCREAPPCKHCGSRAHHARFCSHPKPRPADTTTPVANTRPQANLPPRKRPFQPFNGVAAGTGSSATSGVPSGSFTLGPFGVLSNVAANQAHAAHLPAAPGPAAAAAQAQAVANDHGTTLPPAQAQNVAPAVAAAAASASANAAVDADADAAAVSAAAREPAEQTQLESQAQEQSPPASNATIEYSSQEGSVDDSRRLRRSSRLNSASDTNLLRHQSNCSNASDPEPPTEDEDDRMEH